MTDMFTHYASMIDRGLESREYCEDTALRRRKAAQKANTARLVNIALAKHAAVLDHESELYTLSGKEGPAYTRAYWRERERLENWN